MKGSTILKRSLALVLTVVMLISCWVFTAPVQANAASQGKFKYKYQLTRDDDADGWNYCNITGYYKNNAGTGTEEKSISFGDKKSTIDSGNWESSEYNDTDFPTKLYVDLSIGGGMTWREFYGTLKIWVYNYATSEYVCIASQQIHAKSSAFSAGKANATATVNTGDYPKATYIDSFGLASGVTSTLTNPTGSSTVTKTISMGTVKDQYGVNWNANPTAYVVSGSGYSVSGSTVTIGSGALATASDWKTTGTIGVKAGSTVLKSSLNGGNATVTFTGTNPTYTVTYKWHTNNDTSTDGNSSVNQTGIYYNQKPTAPTKDSNNNTIPTKYYTTTKHYSGGSFSPQKVTSTESTRTNKMNYSSSANHSYVYSQITGNDDNHLATCDINGTKCGYTENQAHNYGKYSDNGDGTHSRTCNNGDAVCGYVETKAHSWGAWQIIPDGEEANYGNHDRMAKHYRVCTADGCGAKDYDNHTWVAQTKQTPTCLSDGHTPYKCSQCQLTTVDLNLDGDGEEDLVPALGHDYEYYAAGTKTDETHQKKCSRCNDIIDVPHPSYGDYYDDSSTQHARDCTVCSHAVKTNHTMTVMQNKIPTGNDFAATTARNTLNAAISAGTFDLSEQHFSYCTVCGRVEDYDHDFEGAETTPATCTEKGVTTYTCSACGESYTDANIPANGHTWGDVKSADVEDVNDNNHAYVYYQCSNEGCGKYCAAIYDTETEEYKPTNNGFNNEGTATNASSISAGADKIPTPYFNDGNSDVSIYEGVDYSYRPASFRYDTSDSTQTMRFAGCVKVPNGVSWQKGSASDDNVILDFGFVYTQTKYICDVEGGKYQASWQTDKKVEVEGKEELGSIDCGHYEYSNPDYTKLVYNEANITGSANIGKEGYKIYKMSVYNPDAQTTQINNGYSSHNIGGNCYLTFNLVIGVAKSNWEKQYCARPYIEYKYRGQTYTVYDNGTSSKNADGTPVVVDGYEKPFYSYRSVMELAEDTMIFSPFDEIDISLLKANYRMQYEKDLTYQVFKDWINQTYRRDKEYVENRFFRNGLSDGDELYQAFLDYKYGTVYGWWRADDIDYVFDYNRSYSEDPEENYYYGEDWFNEL